MADGIRADVDGNIWVGSGWWGKGYDGVQVFSPQGQRIGMILLPEICATSVSAVLGETGCLWPQASRSTRSTSETSGRAY
jgi:sugar lactone lactonase YvrE